MKLSTKEQYAIKAMIHLAINYNSNTVTLTELSDSQTISISYLEQLFSILRKSGLVQGVRGPGGGYRLVKAPNQTSISDIVVAIEASTNNTKSKENVISKKHKYSLANNLWDNFSGLLSVYLGSIYLSDIIKDQVVIKNQFQLDETTRRISTMFPVSADVRVA